MAINLNSVVSRNPQIISSKMDNEVVMMSVEKGNYYGLNQVGSDIWEKLTGPLTVTDLCSKLLIEYNVEREQCEHDVMPYLEKLVEEGLILVSNQTA